MAQDSRTLGAVGVQLERARRRAFRGLGDASVQDLQSAFSAFNRQARSQWNAGDAFGAQTSYQNAVAIGYQLDPSGNYGSDDLAFTRSVMGQSDGSQAGAAVNPLTGTTAAQDAASGADLLARAKIIAKPDPNTGILGNLDPNDIVPKGCLQALKDGNPLGCLSTGQKVVGGLALGALLYAILRR